MELTKKDQIQLVLGALPLLLAGPDLIANGNLAVGVASLSLGILNLLAIPMYARFKRHTHTWLNLGNSLVAFLTAYSYYTDDKEGLPYVWVVAGLLYLFAAYKSYSKTQTPS
ncbi:hypothetical protein SAMN05421823_106297 [Catalinimonas alkaloidigena]|uniref:SPW repeat-containing protein n=1 Tax=Catalinimonas alkaloidigena TaxID=1075417 RepID=A0A1G9KZR3_9BACT|nr:hypothetical protein [Catalinimonas alkaloidigena]SDL55149.1 hypothetical protein SAMN05421823_106297 [Catalinimonas alkaloidigena]